MCLEFEKQKYVILIARKSIRKANHKSMIALSKHRIFLLHAIAKSKVDNLELNSVSSRNKISGKILILSE